MRPGFSDEKCANVEMNSRVNGPINPKILSTLRGWVATVLSCARPLKTLSHFIFPGQGIKSKLKKKKLLTRELNDREQRNTIPGGSGSNNSQPLLNLTKEAKKSIKQKMPVSPCYGLDFNRMVVTYIGDVALHEVQTLGIKDDCSLSL